MENKILVCEYKISTAGVMASTSARRETRVKPEDQVQVGIVTGAGRGMGLACARRLAATVDALLLVDLDEAAGGGGNAGVQRRR